MKAEAEAREAGRKGKVFSNLNFCSSVCSHPYGMCEFSWPHSAGLGTEAAWLDAGTAGTWPHARCPAEGRVGGIPTLSVQTTGQGPCPELCITHEAL